MEYLRTQPLGRLATAQPDGTLQVSPVGFGYNAELGTIDIGGYRMTRSRKYRNVADNGRVAFVVDDLRSRDPWRVRCLEIRGTAEVVPEPGAHPHPPAAGDQLRDRGRGERPARDDRARPQRRLIAAVSGPGRARLRGR